MIVHFTWVRSTKIRSLVGRTWESEAGYRKPNSKGLEMISEKYGTPISELIFVGDEEKDKDAAANAKCRFVRICRTESSSDSISNLLELLEVLESEEK